METKEMVPKLRFPGFNLDWDLQEVSKITPENKKYGIVDGPFGSNLKTIHYRDSGIPIITSGYVTSGIFSASEYKYVTQEKYEKEIRSSVSGGDIVMAKIGANCGASAILPIEHEDGILSGNALKISVDNNRFSTVFIWNILYRLFANGTIGKLRSTGAQPAISMVSLKKFKLCIPFSLEEQQKIASFLSSLDEKISQLEKKRTLLETYKRGIMQKIFSQELRFMDENGEEFPDWSFEKGNTLFSSITNKNHNSDLPILAISQEFGAVPRDMIDYSINVSKKSVSSYKVVEKGNFIISLRSFQGGIEYSRYKGICSPAYIILKANVNIVDRFFKEYFKTHYYIQQLNSKLEGIRDGKMISYKYFSEIELPYPTILEQQKIASFLSSVDKKIEITSTQLEKTREFKKGLLQQMFV